MIEKMSAEEMEQYSRAHGFLAKRLYAITTTPLNGLEGVQAASEEHLARQISLEKKGALFAAGPLLTDDGLFCEGEGMIIIRAGSLAEARLIADKDPMHRRGARSYRIRPWLLNEGMLNLEVHLSNGSVIFR